MMTPKLNILVAEDDSVSRKLMVKLLKKSGYEVWQTPFGYFLDLDMQAPGTPLARLFKDIQVNAK